MTEPGSWGLRHIYTAPESQQGENSGFQSVAYTDDLGGLVSTIGSFVNGFTAPEGDEPSCRQLLKIPELDAYALTTFTPTGPMPDGRPGNYHAETIVVPQNWLEDAQWDTRAAFVALDWIGPTGTFQDDKPFSLPTLKPGSMDRLAILKDLVPARRLAPLLRAVVHQSGGLGQLRILAATETSPADLEQLVMCLPLLVHPSLRVYQDGEQLRCLTFRTVSPHQRMLPATDITGFPATAAEDLEMERSSVIDLGGQFPIPRKQGQEGSAYISWLEKVILEDRWSDLIAEYEKEQPGSSTAWFASFRRIKSSKPQSPSPSAPATPTRPRAGKPQHIERPFAEPKFESPERVTEPDNRPSVMAQRAAAQTRRDRAEGQAEIAYGTTYKVFQEQLDAYQNSLDAAAKKLSEVVTNKTAEFTTQVNNVSQKAEDSNRKFKKSLAERLDDLEKSVDKLTQQVGGLQQQPRPMLSNDGPERPEKGNRSVGSIGGSGSVKGWPERLETWARSLFSKRQTEQRKTWKNSWPVRLLEVGGVLGVAVLIIYQFIGPTSTIDTSPDTEAAAELEDAKKRRTERRRLLVKDFENPTVAWSLLAKIQADPVSDKTRPFIQRAQKLALATTLGRIPITNAGQIAILQQALGIGVDGGWGAGSRRTLATKLDDCQQCLPEASQARSPAELLENDLARLKWDGIAASCVLRVQLKLNQERCSKESIWLEKRSWSEAEAARSLALIETTAGKANQALKQELAKFDLSASSTIENTFKQINKLSPEQAENFLNLAYSWMEQEAGAELSGNPAVEQFEKLEELVKSLKAPGTAS